MTAVSVIWLFLYSKGWSPQFVVWILALLVLLTPSMHGVVLALALTAINFVESTVFLLVLPQEQWLLVATVLARTLLLVLLAAEWLGQISACRGCGPPYAAACRAPGVDRRGRSAGGRGGGRTARSTGVLGAAHGRAPVP